MTRTPPPCATAQERMDHEHMNGDHMAEFRADLNRRRIKPAQVTDALRLVIRLDSCGVDFDSITLSASTPHTHIISAFNPSFGKLDRLMGYPARRVNSRDPGIVSISGSFEGLSICASGCVGHLDPAPPVEQEGGA